MAILRMHYMFRCPKDRLFKPPASLSTEAEPHDYPWSNGNGWPRPSQNMPLSLREGPYDFFLRHRQHRFDGQCVGCHN
eukprot:2184856-Pleurochrysis_carterae.AAC.1